MVLSMVMTAEGILSARGFILHFNREVTVVTKLSNDRKCLKDLAKTSNKFEKDWRLIYLEELFIRLR